MVWSVNVLIIAFPSEVWVTRETWLVALSCDRLGDAILNPIGSYLFLLTLWMTNEIELGNMKNVWQFKVKWMSVVMKESHESYRWIYLASTFIFLYSYMKITLICFNLFLLFWFWYFYFSYVLFKGWPRHKILRRELHWIRTRHKIQQTNGKEPFSIVIQQGTKVKTELSFLL